jgi:hypothetical protein
MKKEKPNSQKESLDLTAIAKDFGGVGTNPVKEKTASWMAKGLFFLLVSFVIIASFFIGYAATSNKDYSYFLAFCDKVFTGLIGLFGAIVGYYFSKKD